MTQPIENLEQLRDIDRELGERLEVEPEIFWRVEAVDGCLHSSNFTRKEWAETELVDFRKRFTWQQFTIVESRYFPKFSTDGNAMLQLIELMAKRRYSFEMRSHVNHKMPRAFFQKGCFYGSAEGADFKQAVAVAARMALRAEAGE